MQGSTEDSATYTNQQRELLADLSGEALRQLASLADQRARIGTDEDAVALRESLWRLLSQLDSRETAGEIAQALGQTHPRVVLFSYLDELLVARFGAYGRTLADAYRDCLAREEVRRGRAA